MSTCTKFQFYLPSLYEGGGGGWVGVVFAFDPEWSLCMSVSMIKLSLCSVCSPLRLSRWLWCHRLLPTRLYDCTRFPPPDALKSLFSPMRSALTPLRGCFPSRSFLFFSGLLCFPVPIHRLWTFLLCQSLIYLRIFGCTSEPHVWSSVETCYRGMLPGVCAQGCSNVSKCTNLKHVSMPPTARMYSENESFNVSISTDRL